MDDRNTTGHRGQPLPSGLVGSAARPSMYGGYAPTAATPAPQVADPTTAARVAFDRAHAAADELMQAMADLGTTPHALGTSDLEWLVKQAQTLANRHDRIRTRALDVVRSTREAGTSHHDNDAQFTAGRTHTDPQKAHRDTQLARTLGNHHPTPPGTGSGPGTGTGTGGTASAGAGTGAGLGEPGASPDAATGTTTGPHRAGTAGGPRVQSATARAWDAGLITRDHALIITRALDDLPDHLTPDQRITVEEHLVATAQQTNPAGLRRAARRALEALNLPEEQVDAHHNQLVHAEEHAAWEAAKFWMKDNHDGTWFGQFTLPTLQAHMLKKALDALTNPRRRNKPDGTATGTGGNGGTSSDNGDNTQDDTLDTSAAIGTGVSGATSNEVSTAATGTTVSGTGATATGQAGAGLTGDARFDRALRDQQRGQAFAELIDHLPADHLGSKINAILLVRTDLQTLRGETDRAGVTDTGTDLSASEVRRLASNAGIIPVVMNGASIPIDLGRQARTYTDTQRAALATLYDTCAAQDCDRPLAWTEIHHSDPWAPVYSPEGELLHPGGGPTDLANGIPLCGKHHRQLTNHRLTHTITRNHTGTATITYTWRTPGDPWNTTQHTPPPHPNRNPGTGTGTGTNQAPDPPDTHPRSDGTQRGAASLP